MDWIGLILKAATEGNIWAAVLIALIACFLGVLTFATKLATTGGQVLMNYMDNSAKRHCRELEHQEKRWEFLPPINPEPHALPAPALGADTPPPCLPERSAPDPPKFEI